MGSVTKPWPVAELPELAGEQLQPGLEAFAVGFVQSLEQVLGRFQQLFGLPELLGVECRLELVQGGLQCHRALGLLGLIGTVPRLGLRTLAGQFPELGQLRRQREGGRPGQLLKQGAGLFVSVYGVRGGGLGRQQLFDGLPGLGQATQGGR